MTSRIVWEVYALDWDEVIETFEGAAAEQRAKDYAEGMDGLGLRCYARPAGRTDDEAA